MDKYITITQILFYSRFLFHCLFFLIYLSTFLVCLYHSIRLFDASFINRILSQKNHINYYKLYPILLITGNVLVNFFSLIYLFILNNADFLHH